MRFLILSNVKVNFKDQELRWISYTTIKAVSSTTQLELVGKKGYAVASLDLEDVISVVYIISLAIFDPSKVYTFWNTQIVSLEVNKTPTTYPQEYSGFADVFSHKPAAKLLEHIGINDHAINFVDIKKLPYRLIYSLELVELKTLKP